MNNLFVHFSTSHPSGFWRDVIAVDAVAKNAVTVVARPIHPAFSKTIPRRMAMATISKTG